MNNMFLKSYIHNLYSNISEYPIGLWNGKMGIAVFFYHYARNFQDREVEVMAESIIDDIYEKIGLDIFFSFNHGLAGVGAGIEHLIQNKFLEGDADEIISDIDLLFNGIILYRGLNSIDIGQGICGLIYYYYMRLKDKHMKDNDIMVLKNEYRLINLIDWLESLIPSATTQEFYDIYLLLSNVRTLDVINFKIDKLLSICLTNLKMDTKVYDNFSYLGIPHFNLLKPWS